jgi:hypothetical protein
VATLFSIKAVTGGRREASRVHCKMDMTHSSYATLEQELMEIPVKLVYDLYESGL